MTFKMNSIVSDCSRIWRRSALALLTVVVVSGCGTEGAPGPVEPSGAVGRVRFVNLINDPARLPVNAILENLPFGVGMAYGGATPQSLPAPATATYSSILAGARTLVLKRTADTSVTVATINFNVAANEDRTIYAVGGASGAAVTSIMTVDANPVPTSAQSMLRIVNMTSGPVDVFVTAAGADLSTATPAVANLGPQTASGYLTLAPGTYQIRFVLAGTPPGLRSSSVSLTVTTGVNQTPSLTLPGGAARTVVAAPSTTGGTPLRSFVLTDK